MRESSPDGDISLARKPPSEAAAPGPICRCIGLESISRAQSRPPTAAARIVNSIPDVIAAAPGIRTTVDLPLPTGKGVVVLD